jgi:hypothetical protein
VALNYVRNTVITLQQINCRKSRRFGRPKLKRDRRFSLAWGKARINRATVIRMRVWRRQPAAAIAKICPQPGRLPQRITFSYDLRLQGGFSSLRVTSMIL